MGHAAALVLVRGVEGQVVTLSAGWAACGRAVCSLAAVVRWLATAAARCRFGGVVGGECGWHVVVVLKLWSVTLSGCVVETVLLLLASDDVMNQLLISGFNVILSG